MKFWTKEQEQAAWNANVRGGLIGFGIGAAIAAPAIYILQRQSVNFRQLPIPAKAFGVVVLVVPATIISAEKAGETYERSQWTGVGKDELDREEVRESKRWAALGTGEKLQDWAGRHKWGLIGGSWAASMVIAGGIVSRNPYQSFSQKLVQARMWAQGLTVGVVVASGVLAGVSSQGEKQVMEVEDHSWRDILEQEENEEKKTKAIASAKKAKSSDKAVVA